MIKVYVAARLSNIEKAKRTINYLKGLGYAITYDWTAHGSVAGQGPVRYQEVAESELAGVITAEVVVALLPGGYGTHCEIGAALARRTRVILVGDHDGPYPCAFHYDKLVTRIPQERCAAAELQTGDPEAWLSLIDDAILGANYEEPAPNEAG